METSVRIQIAPVSLERIGYFLVRSAFFLLFAILVFLTWKAPEVLPFFPVVLLAGVAMWYVFQHPLLNLCLVLASFVLIVDFEEGIQATEVLYGLYYLTFLAHWFITRGILYGERIFVRREERVLFLFLVLMTLSFPLTLLFGGTMRSLMGEWLSLSLLAFYFPVREAVERYPRGVYIILAVITWIGLYVLVRNIIHYREIISNAAFAWQVTRGRSVTNEGFLLIPAVFSLIFLLYSNRWRYRSLGALSFILFLAGLILTQSRGSWIAFLVSVILISSLLPTRLRIRLGLIGIASLAGIVGLGILQFGSVFLLIVSGVLDRFLSIGSALSSDISLVNRIIETNAVWEHIKLNPVLGYGMGVPYRVFDITFEFSRTKTFIHNGYIALWYKFGVWGLGLILVFLASVFRRAVVIYRNRDVTILQRGACLAVAAAFGALAISALTSNPFYVNDQMFIVALLAGLAGGCSNSAEYPRKQRDDKQSVV